jgi:hypothetical protein
MNWRHWLRVIACFGFLALVYADAARSDERAQQQVLTALQEVSGAWHP